MATLESLQAKIAKLQVQAEAIAKKDSSAVIEKIRGLMEKHGLTSTDIDAHVGGGKKRGPKPGAKAALAKRASAARYRDPKSGATWTGQGRAPSWIASAKDRTKYLVEGTSAGSVPASKPATAKAGNYVRGVQPALYADPKTGATWSGRGRAPAWIAGAKDRTKFLIATTGEGKAGAKAVAGKKAAPAKKTAAKKATAKKVTTKKATATKGAPAAKKATAKKVAVKKAAVEKVAAKKVVARKATAKKTVAKKAAVKTKPVTPSAAAVTPDAPTPQTTE
ncbi:H-NS family nucleoid-associated regulatory protein [Paraburkholderia terrae]|uniref:H-NS family nucleoid-associated regulatory protein n=1 Tax=Paraburkholderia terrae TaxID=311230 RepID=UPI00296B18E3|nr:H-NS family nucleoid-associated regulatory protein [Paraburkholderia terrae]MDW3657819.1 H-NS family nucleoid-associated regulatory protein [Paraburkholderia terrae]